MGYEQRPVDARRTSRAGPITVVGRVPLVASFATWAGAVALNRPLGPGYRANEGGRRWRLDACRGVNAGLGAVTDRDRLAGRLFRIVVDDPEAGDQLGRAVGVRPERVSAEVV
jgi:hypothetical protein